MRSATNVTVRDRQVDWNWVLFFRLRSSGDVFLCKHITDKNYNYALKRIKIFEVDEKERENIENELKILQKLRHINIVSYKDSFTDKEGNLCIVMVYCELGDMHTKIKQMKEKGKNFTEPQILDWITQIALAIYYLHNQKILHRDLKTQNLFLKRDDRIKDDRIKLGDFGIAKVLDSTQDLARTCIGTPYYMAPEIFKYKPYSYKRYFLYY